MREKGIVRYRFPEARLWYGMRGRCLNPAHEAYKDYGGRGITIYKPWRDSFAAFLKYIRKHLGPRPDGWTLDRIDNSSGYKPGNLRWATRAQQTDNRRTRDRSIERRAKVDEFHARGYKAKEIAMLLEISRATVSRLLCPRRGQ